MAVNHPCAVSYADLFYLYPCLVFICKVFNQLPEVHTILSREVKDHPALIKGILNINPLPGKSAFFYPGVAFLTAARSMRPC